RRPRFPDLRLPRGAGGVAALQRPGPGGGLGAGPGCRPRPRSRPRSRPRCPGGLLPGRVAGPAVSGGGARGGRRPPRPGGWAAPRGSGGWAQTPPAPLPPTSRARRRGSVRSADLPVLEEACRRLLAQEVPIRRLDAPRHHLRQLFKDDPFKLQLLEEGAAPTATVYGCGSLVELCGGPHLRHTGLVAALRLLEVRAAGAGGGPGRGVGGPRPARTGRLTAPWRVTSPRPRATRHPHRASSSNADGVRGGSGAAGAAARVRRLLPHGRGAAGLGAPAGRSQEQRPPPHRQGAGTLLLPRAEPGGLLLPAPRDAGLQRPRGLHPERVRPARLRGGADPDAVLHPAVGAVGTLGSLPGQHVRAGPPPRPHLPRRHGPPRLPRPQAHELPRSLPAVRAPSAVLDGAALRLAEFGVLHRHEASGTLGGLTRLRRFQQDDAHIFCAPEQLEAEVRGCLDFIRSVYTVLGFSFRLALSTRPPGFLGDPDLWDRAEQVGGGGRGPGVGEGGDDARSRPPTPPPPPRSLRRPGGFRGALGVEPRDGAFYGPKIDVHVRDALGRPHQCGTVQLDFQMPLRFDLRYTGRAGTPERPVLVHRAVLGSVERTMAVLAESCGGKWPLWLSPLQAVVIPVGPKQEAYAREVRRALRPAGWPPTRTRTRPAPLATGPPGPADRLQLPARGRADGGVSGHRQRPDPGEPAAGGADPAGRGGAAAGAAGRQGPQRRGALLSPGARNKGQSEPAAAVSVSVCGVGGSGHEVPAGWDWDWARAWEER
uniref:threonine--tRNA ligase n=1 Tax=Ornithorhynchus anatinus TaxID=9258 RepID=A0A6I8N1I2_ORNAN